MLSYHNDKFLKIEYNPVNNKDAFSRNAVGSHAYISIAEADYIYTDLNSIFISNTTGNDSTGNGSQANPYKTILKGMNSCTALIMKVIVLDNFLYDEDISTMTNIFFQGMYAASGQTPKLSLRQYENSYVPSNTNTIFVSDSTGSDSTGSGTEASPVKSISKAMTLLSVSIQNILIIDSSTYIIQAFAFKDNMKNLRAKVGEKPIIRINYSQTVQTLGETQFHPNPLYDRGNESSCILSNDDIVIAYGGLSYNNYQGAGLRIFSKTGTLKYSYDFASTIDNIKVARINNQFILSYYCSNGAASQIEIRNNDGSVDHTLSLGTTYWRHTKIIPISSTRFAITFNYADGNNSGYVMLFDETLAQIGSTTLIVSGTSYWFSYITGCLLSDGTFAVVYRGTASGTYAKIFNTSLVQQGSTINIDSGAHPSLQTEAIGDNQFIVVYTESSSDQSIKFKILNNAGTILYSQTLPEPSFSSIYWGPQLWLIPLGNYCFGIQYTTGATTYKISYYFLNRFIKTNSISGMAISYYNGYDTSYAYGTNNFSKFSDGTLLYTYSPYFKIIKAPNYIFPIVETDIKINGIEFDLTDVINIESLFLSMNSEIELYNTTVKNSKNGFPLDTDCIPAWIINSNDKIKIRNSYFTDCDAGAKTVSNFTDVQDSVFCRILRGYAVSVDGAAATTGDIIVEHNTFFNGYGAIELKNNSGANREIIKNNILHENDIFEIYAQNVQTYSYSCLSGTNSDNVSQGSMVILANPLFVNDGNYNPDDTDLHLRLRFIGFKVNSPAVGLSDDGRNAGAYDDIYIGELMTWDSVLIEKPKKINVGLEPVGAIANISRDGAIDTSVESFTEHVVLVYDSIILSDFNKFKDIFLCKKSEVRLYPDAITYPLQFNLYKIYFEKVASSPDYWIQSDLGVHGFSIKFSRKYE